MRSIQLQFWLSNSDEIEVLNLDMRTILLKDDQHGMDMKAYIYSNTTINKDKNQLLVVTILIKQ